MTDFTALAEDYIAAWNETDPARRRRLVERVWAADARYVDPLVEVEGHDGIDAVVVGAQEAFPGHTFALVGPVDAHHDQARFGWSLAQGDAEPLVIGFDVVVAGSDGRLRTVLGFLDRVPAA